MGQIANLQVFVLVAHVVISIAIVALVLLQRGKGAEAGAAFGAGASGTVFGAKGSANFLSRTTAVLATLFFVSSLTLAYLGGQQPETRSLLDELAPTGVQGPGMEPLPEAPTEEPAGDGALPDLPALPAEGGEAPE